MKKRKSNLPKNHFQLIYLQLEGDYSRENVSQCITEAEDLRELSNDIAVICNSPVMNNGLDEVRQFYRTYGFDKLIDKIKTEGESIGK